MKKRTGFTLIELLVVVAIISVLIALLMPALASARQSAKLISCGSQLHQLGMALSSYAFEHSDKYPPGTGFNYPWMRHSCTDYKDLSFIGNDLLPYVGNKVEIFYCPVAPDGTTVAYYRTSLSSSPNNNSHFLISQWGDLMMGYMYLGNFCQQGSLYSNQVQSSVYCPTGLNGDRLKVMQDIVTSWIVPYTDTSHKSPNSLYTDGSVVSRKISQLKADGGGRWASYYIYWKD
jgi:prepilin-type N-terminal cleavage/methylation domain-containing protein